MAERLTLDEAIRHCEEKTDCTQCGEEHRQLAEWLRELQKYKDLEEQGRLVILPEDEEKVQALNEKLLELTDITEAALKGAENDNL